MSKVTLLPEVRECRGNSRDLWVIRRDGKYIIGDTSETMAEKFLAQLEENGWRFLECYHRGYPDPLDWINHVREQKWTFEDFSFIEYLDDGRIFFLGNFEEYSAVFRYLILDAALAEQIAKLVPEVKVLR